MAQPVSPVLPGQLVAEVVYAKNQQPYKPLPAYCSEDGHVLSRWKLTWRERLLALFFGDVYLWVSTNNTPLQPVKIQVEKPKAA